MKSLKQMIPEHASALKASLANSGTRCQVIFAQGFSGLFSSYSSFVTPQSQKKYTAPTKNSGGTRTLLREKPAAIFSPSCSCSSSASCPTTSAESHTLWAKRAHSSTAAHRELCSSPRSSPCYYQLPTCASIPLFIFSSANLLEKDCTKNCTCSWKRQVRLKSPNRGDQTRFRKAWTFCKPRPAAQHTPGSDPRAFRKKLSRQWPAISQQCSKQKIPSSASLYKKPIACCQCIYYVVFQLTLWLHCSAVWPIWISEKRWITGTKHSAVPGHGSERIIQHPSRGTALIPHEARQDTPEEQQGSPTGLWTTDHPSSTQADPLKQHSKVSRASLAQPLPYIYLRERGRVRERDQILKDLHKAWKKSWWNL